MERDLYVDSVISSVRDENEAKQYFYEARQIMATAGFSCIVLHWLKSAKSLKRFVTNRVNETRKSTSEAEWRYCPTEHSPADLVLGLFLDSNGLLRCNGRIHNAPVPELAKFPYLLPQYHEFTKLIVFDAQEYCIWCARTFTSFRVERNRYVLTPAVLDFSHPTMRKKRFFTSVFLAKE